MKVVSPEFSLTAFTCPHCSAYANMTKRLLVGIDKGQIRPSEFLTLRCTNCNKASLWLGDFNIIKKADGDGLSYPCDGKMIYPSKTVGKPPSEDMPKDIAADYVEAQMIASVSPRAAAALLRLALQKLLAHLGSKKSRIDDSISELVKQNKISGDVTRVADILRVTGNDSVHPGKMNDDDRSEITNKLFDFLNFFVYETITRPKEIESMYSMLPEGARRAVDKRDAK